ncbi:hypothetical protein GGR75_004341 [Xanthomonas campestris]|nr:hypothetical protein [Xanthomonas campestris]
MYSACSRILGVVRFLFQSTSSTLPRLRSYLFVKFLGMQTILPE